MLDFRPRRRDHRGRAAPRTSSHSLPRFQPVDWRLWVAQQTQLSWSRVEPICLAAFVFSDNHGLAIHDPSLGRFFTYRTAFPYLLANIILPRGCLHWAYAERAAHREEAQGGISLTRWGAPGPERAVVCDRPLLRSRTVPLAFRSIMSFGDQSDRDPAGPRLPSLSRRTKGRSFSRTAVPHIVRRRCRHDWIAADDQIR